MIYAENILLCIGIPLLLTLLFLRDNARRFVLGFLLGMAACLLAAYVSGFLDLVSGMGQENTAVFLSPVMEELMKLLPLLAFLLLFRPEDGELLQTAIGIGVGFATFENCCNMLTAGAASLSHILVRSLAVGVMHVVSILALTLGLALTKRVRMLSFPCVLGAYSLSATFHAMYNLLVSEPGTSRWIGYALPLLTALLLYGAYRRLRV
ncbi:MAG: PrsW family intramembrane metalloprotease [Oscillospiraceae bacterium]|nr:PrsW family intramembrane metalloprotease [Oscillospiraceae bacterium]